MHLFQCKDPELVKIFKDGLNELEDTLQKRHAPSEIWQAIRDRIMQYSSSEAHNFCKVTGSVREAAEAQTRIGWDQFLKGRLSNKWGKCMRDKYANSPSLRRLESKQWFVKAVIHYFWAVYAKLWACRCARLHNDTEVDSLSVEASDAKIRFFFGNKTMLFDSGDFDRFHMGIEHTLALHPTQKRAWLQT